MMMRSSSSPSLAKSIFSLGTQATMIERSNSTPSSTPARPPRSPLGVDEEYDQAFRSKSFLDLWSHAHHHLSHTFSSFKLPCNGGAGNDRKDDDGHGDGGDTEKSCSYTVLDDFVLEPSPELLALQHRRRRSRRRHRVETLLVEYFDVTEEACAACSALLVAIGAARRHHLTLRRLLLRLDGGDGDAADDAKDALTRHVRLDNPLSSGSLAGFHDAHARCSPLATRLAAARRRLRRLSRAVRVARGAAAAALIGACAAAIVAAAVLAAHALVGIGVAAAAFGGATPAAAATARARWWWGRRAAAAFGSRHHYARAGDALDAAARGAYIVGRALDTVSRMVRRAHDELEHGRDVARIAMRGHGERPLLQEVAREEEECEEDLKAQLAELEEHVCLCLITINRTRRLVTHEMTRGLPPSTETTAAAAPAAGD